MKSLKKKEESRKQTLLFEASLATTRWSKKHFQKTFYPIKYPVTVGLNCIFKFLRQWKAFRVARCTCGPRYGVGNGPIRSVLVTATSLPGAALDLDPGAAPTAIIAATIAKWPHVRLCRRARARAESVHFAEVPGVTSASLSPREHLFYTTFVGIFSILVVISRS